MSRFMSLPPELRLLVYERLPRNIYSYHIPIGDSSGNGKFLVLFLRTIDLAVLSTCQQIRGEATGCIQHVLDKFILDKLPQLQGSQHEIACLGVNVLVGAAESEADRIKISQELVDHGHQKSLHLRVNHSVQIMHELSRLHYLANSQDQPAVRQLKHGFLQKMPIIIRWVKQAGRQLYYCYRQAKPHYPPLVAPYIGHFRYITIYSCDNCLAVDPSEDARKKAHAETPPTWKTFVLFHKAALTYWRAMEGRVRLVYIEGHIYDKTGQGRLAEPAYEHWDPLNDPDLSSFPAPIGRAHALISKVRMSAEEWKIDWAAAISGDDEQPGDEKPGDEKPGDEQPGDEQPGGEKSGDEKSGDEKPLPDLAAGS